MGNPLVRFCVGAGEQLKVWLRSCGTAGKPGGKQRKQTSAYSHGRPRSTRPIVEYPRPDFLKDTSIIRNLIFTIQQVTIMQVFLNNGSDDICNFGRLVVFSETVEKVFILLVSRYSFQFMISFSLGPQRSRKFSYFINNSFLK